MICKRLATQLTDRTIQPITEVSTHLRVVPLATGVFDALRLTVRIKRSTNGWPLFFVAESTYQRESGMIKPLARARLAESATSPLTTAFRRNRSKKADADSRPFGTATD